MKNSCLAFVIFAALWSGIAYAGGPAGFAQTERGANDQVAICWGKHNEPLQEQVDKCTATLNQGGWTPQQALQILFHRADVYRQMGQIDHQMADFDLAVTVAPRIGKSSVAAAYNERCFARAESGQELDTALSDCNAALALRPEEADFLDSRCFVYFRMGNYAAAITDCDAAVKEDSEESTSIYVRGLAKLKTGDAAGGNADIAAAEKIDEKVADTYAGYGVKP
jgi:tetratricopeptide (TPR) repeat protein